MTDAARAQTTCIVCGEAVEPILDLGEQPLANALIARKDEAFVRHPLGLARCPNCAHGQLTHFVDPEVLFRDYLYASGTSGTLRAFFEGFARSLKSVAPTDAAVLEIASNDGSLLNALAAEGYKPWGVDPARNLCEVARAAGHEILEGFFPDVRPERLADVIIAMNVAAHTPDPLTFMKGVADSLAPTGVAIIQTSQAFMLGNGEFDTIYHEHFSFYTVASMAALAERAGLKLEQTHLVSVHGTSFLFFLRKADYAGPEAPFAPDPDFAVDWPAARPEFLERDFGGAAADQRYARFAGDARRLMDEVSARVETLRGEGRRLGVIGVAAKALTFVHAAGLEPDAFFDEAPLKIGRYVPGAKAPIRPLTDLAGIDGPWTLLIGAWNFADELSAKIEALSAGHAPDFRFIVHLPTLREFDLGTGGRGADR